MSLTNIFVPEITNCREILNAGSAVYVAPLPNCADEPVVYTINTASAVAALAVVASLQITLPATPPSTIVLRAGSVLKFGADYLTIAANTVIGTASPTNVPIQPAINAIPISTTALSWGALKLLSPTSIPIDNQSQTVNSTSLSNGLQGSEAKTKVMMSSQIELITNPTDSAYWEYVYNAGLGADDVYCLLVRGTDQRHAWGRAKVTNLNEGGQIEEISRTTFTLSFQASYAAPTLFPYLSVDKQAVLNLTRTYAGLPVLV